MQRVCVTFTKLNLVGLLRFRGLQYVVTFAWKLRALAFQRELNRSLYGTVETAWNFGKQVEKTIISSQYEPLHRPNPRIMIIVTPF